MNFTNKKNMNKEEELNWSIITEYFKTKGIT